MILRLFEREKNKEFRKIWDAIDEDEPTDEEKKTCIENKNSIEELIPLDDLVRELNLEGK